MRFGLHLSIIIAGCLSFLDAAPLYYQQADNAALMNNVRGEYVLTMVGVNDKTLVYPDSLTSQEDLLTPKFYDQVKAEKSQIVVAIIQQSKNKSLSFRIKTIEYNQGKKSLHLTVEPLQDVLVNQVSVSWGNVGVLLQKSI